MPTSHKGAQPHTTKWADPIIPWERARDRFLGPRNGHGAEEELVPRADIEVYRRPIAERRSIGAVTGRGPGLHLMAKWSMLGDVERFAYDCPLLWAHASRILEYHVYHVSFALEYPRD